VLKFILVVRQEAKAKRLLAILHFVTYLGFFMPNYLCNFGGDGEVERKIKPKVKK
jgi:hypothetical protein